MVWVWLGHIVRKEENVVFFVFIPLVPLLDSRDFIYWNSFNSLDWVEQSRDHYNLSVPDKLHQLFQNSQYENGRALLRLDYTCVRPVTLLIYILQMFLGGQPWRDSRGDHNLFFVLLVFAMKWTISLPHANVALRTIETLTVQNLKTLSSGNFFIRFNLLEYQQKGIRNSSIWCWNNFSTCHRWSNSELGHQN